MRWRGSESPDAPSKRRPPILHTNSWTARYTEAAGIEVCRVESPGPLTAERGPLTVLLHGELYDRPELLQRWELAPDASDADIVLAAWHRHGAECLSSLRGIFSLLVRDRDRGELVAARDAMGTQPLFHTRQGASWWFSNDFDAIVRSPGAERRLSREVIACHLTYRWPQAHETLYDDVSRVPMSHALFIRAGAERYERYWHPPIPELETDWIREDVGAGFAEVFDRAVRRRVRLGRPGIFLSGGLDSVSVAAFATESCRRNGESLPLALSLEFPGDLSERPIQTGVAKALGIEQIMMNFEEAIGTERILPAALEVARDWPTPWFHFWQIVYLSLARTGSAAGVRVLLSGGGGDEWLTVDPRWGSDLIWRLDLPRLYRHLRTSRRSFNTSLLPMLRANLWTHGVKPLGLSAMVHGLRAVSRRGHERFLDWYARRQMSVIPDWFLPDPELRERIRQRVRHYVHEEKPWARPGQNYINLMHSTHHPIMETETEGHFQMSRESGTRMLLPFWDVDVMAFLRRVHPDALTHGGRSKGPVRGALSARFPDLGFDRQKKLLAGNRFAKLMKADAPAAYRSLDGLRTLREMGVVDSDRFKAQVVDRLDGPVEMMAQTQLWIALRFESWIRAHA